MFVTQSDVKQKLFQDVDELLSAVPPSVPEAINALKTYISFSDGSCFDVLVRLAEIMLSDLADEDEGSNDEARRILKSIVKNDTSIIRAFSQNGSSADNGALDNVKALSVACALLGQLSSGRESLNYYEKSIRVSEVCGNRESILEACVAIAELYMTDLCDEPEAQDACLERIEQAGRIDNNNLEYLNLASSYFKVIGEQEKALELATKAHGIIVTLVEGANNDPLPEEACVASIVRTLLDLGKSDEALYLIDNVLLEADADDIEAWFLAGCAHAISGDKEAAQECAETIMGVESAPAKYRSQLRKQIQQLVADRFKPKGD